MDVLLCSIKREYRTFMPRTFGIIRGFNKVRMEIWNGKRISDYDANKDNSKDFNYRRLYRRCSSSSLWRSSIWCRRRQRWGVGISGWRLICRELDNGRCCVALFLIEGCRRLQVPGVRSRSLGIWGLRRFVLRLLGCRRIRGGCRLGSVCLWSGCRGRCRLGFSCRWGRQLFDSEWDPRSSRGWRGKGNEKAVTPWWNYREK